MKNFGNGTGQYSYFAVRLYAENDNQVYTLCKDELQLRHYAFILHDRDIYTDDNENHKKGDKKTPHYHIVMNTTAKCSWKVLQNKILKVMPSCSPILSDIKDTENATLYLTHETKDAQKKGKFQYSKNEVRSDNYTYWLSYECKQENKSEKVDYIQEFVNVFYDNGEYIDKATVKAYSQQYGRDFILNFHKLIQFLEDYTGRKQNTLYTDHEIFVNGITNNIMLMLEEKWGLSTIVIRTKDENNKKLLEETEGYIKEEISQLIK